MATTTRLGLPSPELDEPADVPADMRELALTLDSAALIDQGLAAGRPAADTLPEGYWFWTTDTLVLAYGDGADWHEINPELISDGPAGTPSLRTLGIGAQQAAAGNDPRLSDQRVPTDNSVTYTKVNTALKPSQGAAGASETLRALGVVAGTAAAGDDPRLGLIDFTRIATPLAKRLGVNNGSIIRSGKKIITTTQSFSSPEDTYIWMTTPDRIDGLLVEAGDVVRLFYFAEWSEEDSDAGRAAIFCTPSGGAAEQLRVFDPDSNTWSHTEARTGNSDPSVSQKNILVAGPYGLASTKQSVLSARPSTGIAMGAADGLVRWKVLGSGQDEEGMGGMWCEIADLAPGTYDVGVRFKTQGDTVRRYRSQLFIEVINYS